LGGLVSAYLTPQARQAALRLGIVDRPDGRLKTQAQPVPYLGGLAVFLSFLLVLGLLVVFDHQLLALLLAGTLALLVGLVDDFGALTPLPKLLGLAVAIFALLRAGVLVELVELPFALHWILAALWLALVANAFNLVDVLDGLAPSLALAAALGMGLVAFFSGQELWAVVAAALAGALGGFLPANWPPARMYLGDAGSLCLGMLLGAMALGMRWSEVSPAGFLAPLAFLALPLSEVAFLVVVRTRRHIPFWRGSPDHVALRWRVLRGGDGKGVLWRLNFWALAFVGAGLLLALSATYIWSLGLAILLALAWALWLLRLSFARVGP
jgi:UDP-GlcNAc:undecaprenyl-phosphate GlcNAc-1-phosphate transferase